MRSHCNPSSAGWGSLNSRPNPISSNTNPELLSGRQRSRAFLTSSSISFRSQTAPQGEKSEKGEDMWRSTRFEERYRPPTFSHSRFGLKCGQMSTHFFFPPFILRSVSWLQSICVGRRARNGVSGIPIQLFEKTTPPHNHHLSADFTPLERDISELDFAAASTKSLFACGLGSV